MRTTNCLFSSWRDRDAVIDSELNFILAFTYVVNIVVEIYIENLNIHPNVPFVFSAGHMIWTLLHC